MITILKREFKFVKSDFDLITILLVAPLFYLFFYSSFYYNKAESKAPVAIVDLDRSLSSKRLIHEIDTHQMLSAAVVTTNFEEAKLSLYKREVFAIAVIPHDFELNSKRIKEVDVNIFLNNSQFLISNDINRAFNDIKAKHDAASTLHFIEIGGVSGENAATLSEPIHPDIRSLFNIGENYGSFFLPGLFFLILQQTLLIGISECIGKEREGNKLPELYETSSRSIFKMLFVKGLFYLMLFMLYMLVVLFIAIPFFKISFPGNPFIVLFVSMLYLITHISFSFFLSSFLKNKLQALILVAFTSYPFLLLSGFAWPQTSMPLVIRWISYVIPGTPFFQSITALMAESKNLTLFIPVVWQLSVMFIIYSTANYFRYKKLISIHQ